MRRFLTNAILAAIDVSILTAALVLAFLLRFDWEIPPRMELHLLRALPGVVTIQFGLLSALGVGRFPWGYVGFREVGRIFGAIALAGAALLVGWSLAFHVSSLEMVRIPLGSIGIDAALAFLGLAGARGIGRLLAERADRAKRVPSRKVPTMLIGAELVGLLVAKELGGRPDLGIDPVGFLDDDPLKTGQVIAGIRVRGDTSMLVPLCRKYGATQALITDSKMPRRDIRRIAQLCERSGIEAKIVPGIFEIVGWRANLSRIRKVAIEDLLGRDPVVLDDEAIASDLRGSTVLVTGAGGSIGSEICRQVCRFQPKALVLLEQAENSLFQIHRELAAAFPSLTIHPCIADVCDVPRLNMIFREHRPEVVFHAAAHKHVPMMEWNPCEAIKNNVVGSRAVADLAHAHEARQFVMISTDKAVNPSSVMGASKRLAEIYVQALSQRSRTRFVTVRFGNVLGSAGSVIPIFQEQIARGGPVTVTHPEMRRYFMTIPEACQLVLEAGSMGRGGEIFVLDMGQPVKIVDLARDLITLSGLTPDEDIEIVFNGIRPGEKLFEELSADSEPVAKTRHPKIFIGRLCPHAFEVVADELAQLREVAEGGNAEALRAALLELLPEYRPIQPEAPAADTAELATAG